MTQPYETALLIVPPPPVQAFCYSIRERHDRASFEKVPAHITLLYPFAPPEDLDPALQRLRPLCRETQPFDVHLNRYGRFEGVVFLEPQDPRPIQELHNRLSEAFSEYPVYGGEHGRVLHPHITLATSDDPAELENIDLPPAPDFTFTVHKLHVYLGAMDSEEPFIPRAVIPLGDTA